MKSSRNMIKRSNSVIQNGKTKQIRSSVSPACRKRRLNGTVSRNNSITRALRGTDRSPDSEYNEYFCYKLDSRVKKLTKEWNEKQHHFITHASRSLLWIQFGAVAFRSEEEGDPVTYFASPWIHPLADMAKTSLCMCQAMSTSSLPSFVNIH